MARSVAWSLHTCCHAATPGARLVLSAQLLFTDMALLD